MSNLKKASNGDYYIVRKSASCVDRNWWLAKEKNTNNTYINFRTVAVPKELMGKKLRFRVEIIEDLK